MNYKQLIVLTCSAGVLGMAACHTAGAEKKIQTLHLAVVTQPGAMLYVDKVDNKRVMKEEKSIDNKHFVSYKVGFYDSTLVTDKKKQEEVGLYYQYKMSYDWKAIVNGDSLSPVFFQPVTTLNNQVKEGILVFELPADKQPDTLVYNDASGTWNTRIIELKATK